MPSLLRPWWGTSRSILLRPRTPRPCKSSSNHSQCCATAKAGNPSLTFKACESARAGKIPCGQDGSASQAGASRDGEKGRATRRACLGVLGLGKVAGRVLASTQTSKLLAAQVPGDGSEVRAPPPPALLALLAYTKQRAQDGDQEAQTIYEQVELAREMDQLDQDLDGTGEPANELLSNGGDVSMQEASEGPPEEEPDRGEEGAGDGDADARTRIRLALGQGVDPLGTSGGTLGSDAAEVLGKFLVKPKSKAKSQPNSQS
eukprot:6478649-Amphidinium_carterae.1